MLFIENKREKKKLWGTLITWPWKAWKKGHSDTNNHTDI